VVPRSRIRLGRSKLFRHISVGIQHIGEFARLSSGQGLRSWDIRDAIPCYPRPVVTPVVRLQTFNLLSEAPQIHRLGIFAQVPRIAD
jgi:hypothetical protein